MYLERLEAIGSHLVSFTTVHFVEGADGGQEKFEGPNGVKYQISTHSGGMIYPVNATGTLDWQKPVGRMVKRTTSKRVMINPSQISDVTIQGFGTADRPCYASVADFVAEKPLKFKNLEEPFHYQSIHVTLANKKEYYLDYEENIDTFEKLHIKFEEEKPEKKD